MSAAPPPPPAPPAAPSRHGLGPAIAVIVAGLVVGVGAVALLLPRWLASAPTESPSASAPATVSRQIHAMLFYVSDNGSELVAASREVTFGATPAEQARLILDAEVGPAPQGFTSAVPAGTAVRSVLLDAHNVAYVDLSRDVVAGHTGGALDEALTVFSIVNAVTVNLPDIPAVQILVDGHAVDTLVGHLDLRHPLVRAPDWVKKGP
jgi:hypothetical protein